MRPGTSLPVPPRLLSKGWYAYNEDNRRIHLHWIPLIGLDFLRQLKEPKNEAVRIAFQAHALIGMQNDLDSVLERVDLLIPAVQRLAPSLLTPDGYARQASRSAIDASEMAKRFSPLPIKSGKKWRTSACLAPRSRPVGNTCIDPGGRARVR